MCLPLSVSNQIHIVVNTLPIYFATVVATLVATDVVTDIDTGIATVIAAVIPIAACAEFSIECYLRYY